MHEACSAQVLVTINIEWLSAPTTAGHSKKMIHPFVTQASLTLELAGGAGIEATEPVHEESEEWSSEVAALQAVYEGMVQVLSPGSLSFTIALPQVSYKDKLYNLPAKVRFTCLAF